jgi:hypothetical protein
MYTELLYQTKHACYNLTSSLEVILKILFKKTLIKIMKGSEYLYALNFKWEEQLLLVKFHSNT